MKTNLKNEIQAHGKNLNKDELNVIFEKHLFHPENDANKVDTLIYNVVVEYLVILMDLGNIPHHLCLALEIDLREEVQEIYERRTIGFKSLMEFREFHNVAKFKRRLS